ncbi:ShlB/FhaC/HecB family hemolysin secretion/activation protein [Massilia sp. HP4]|uniref:ShlB/FhaC/HecB family hemolysin secretion/activation protein n=1 Tax=Massilia sp. HP4 TaxID=2562316 RepID=UPI0014851FB9|nr:ShlB/FhaC/HecB family hemolysin secretion/activation protein [Massilia sp. HP4]
MPATVAATITAIRVEGNTLLPDSTFALLTSGVTGAAPDLDALHAVAARIQNAYREAGYGGVLAYVPPQDSNDGVVIVRVVEGKLAQVRVTGNGYFSSANVRAGLPHLQQGATPRIAAIDRDIGLTNSNPRKRVNVSLSAGANPGEIDADVSVTDARPLQVLVGYNNTGTGMTGRHRLSIGVEHANLFDSDHVGTLQFQTSPEHPGRVRIFSGGYRVPLYAHAASLDAFVAHSTVNNGTTATTAGPLTFTGRGTIVGLRANRHLDRIGEYDHQLTLGLDRRDYRDDCAIGDFGAAGCGSAAVDVTTLPVSLSYTGQLSGSRVAHGVSVTLAINAGGSAARTFEAARASAKRQYTVGRFTGFTERALSGGGALSARVEFQYSAHALIAAEKFGLGGAGSVRGYTERELSGDHGYLVRAEAALASADWASGLRLRPYAFVDHGRVVNRGELPCRGVDATACSLTGAGIGLRLTLPRRASATLDVARALERGASSASGDMRAHAAFNLAL